jgi:putative (di)nucleoside polyphosphate hydrolase
MAGRLECARTRVLNRQDVSGGFTVIDPDGYRPNVGIILINRCDQVFWARRVRRDGWQFPQGGMNSDETPVEAMYRELHEETGLAPEAVEIMGSTAGWLRYRLPQRHLRSNERLPCIGQKQVWFLLRLVGEEGAVRLDGCEHPEFDLWRWVDFWYPLRHVVHFKRRVYAKALSQLAPLAGIEVQPWLERFLNPSVATAHGIRATVRSSVPGG